MIIVPIHHTEHLTAIMSKFKENGIYEGIYIYFFFIHILALCKYVHLDVSYFTFVANSSRFYLHNL